MAEEIYRELVPEALAGQRVDRVVALAGNVSRRQAAALVAAGDVLVDGAPVDKPSVKLQLGQELSFQFEREEIHLEADDSVAFDIIHVDSEVIVVYKPPGLVVHPGSGVGGSTLVNGLLSRFPDLRPVGQTERPGIVHRLDRGTSGLLVVARTEMAYEHLVDQLRRRSVERRYLSLVIGNMESERGLIDAPLGRSPRDATKRAVVADGLEARTFYEVIERFVVDTAPTSSTDIASQARFTLINCRLETGRTHQIRAHLLAIGHPVAGDVDYDGAVAHPEALASLSRPFLHAETLGFDHPVSGQRLRFTSPLPQELAQPLGVLQAAV